MQFLLKLFKALNSAQSPWQVTLAITLGMIAGLTPISGLQNAVILLLAFLLNIHLGLFFVSAALFAGIGYLFDPWFEQLGYAILSSEGLQGLWTGFYNNGFVRLTHFNNTLVMGATVVSLLMAVANFRVRRLTRSSTAVTLLAVAGLFVATLFITYYELATRLHQMAFILFIYLLLTLGAWLFARKKRTQ